MGGFGFSYNDESRKREQWIEMMSTATGVNCQKKLDYCPEGHRMQLCKTPDGDSGRWCQQCGSTSYQPNRNKYGENCRIRRTCDKNYMTYESYGSTTKNAVCKCQLGYHFENEDQRACVPNRTCGKGYGLGQYGICEKCLDRKMWSDTTDAYSQCKPLKNCEKESRCVIVESNGTNDNKCGPKVTDVTNCDSIVYQTTTPAPESNTGLIVGVALGGVVLFLALLLLLVWWLRQSASRRQRTLTTEEREEILKDVMKRCRKDDLYCKKVLTIGQKEVEDKINNQIWALLQELFREHLEPAKSEVLLEKYKVQSHKYAVNGYMNDWRGWRGDTGDAVEELVRSLRSDKVKREDILYEIVMKLKEDYPEVVYATNKRSAKPNTAKHFCASFLPCACKDEERDSYEIKEETSSKLLDTQMINETDNGYAHAPPPPTNTNSGDGGELTPTEAGVTYRAGPTPSAPMIHEEPYYDESLAEIKGTHFYDRSDSLPVQASS